MHETDTPNLIDPVSEAERPTLSTLLGQLIDDGSAFARAEIAFLRSQAGERASYALPGIIMIGVAAALGLGAIVALLVMLSFWLATKIKSLLAIAIVFAAAIIVAALLAKFGVVRLGGALKSRDER